MNIYIDNLVHIILLLLAINLVATLLWIVKQIRKEK
jgi:hypothetical protein